MSEARTAVLARLRDALPRDASERATAEATVAERLREPPENLIPGRGQVDREQRALLFAELAVAVMADVQRVRAMTDVPVVVAAYLRQHNLPQRLVMAPEPYLDRCRWDSQPLLRVRRGTAVDDDAVGLTIAVAGVAETGTLVLSSSEDRPQLLAYLPETSIVVLPVDWIEPAYEQAFERARTLPGGVARTVNFVTGPSRTADIAQKLELGAHGPRRLLIVLVDDTGR